MTLALTLLLGGIYMAMQLVFTPEFSETLLLRFGFVPATFFAWLDGSGPAGPALWPLVTHLLLHLDAFHLLTNLGFLLAFGSAVERRSGGLWLLVFFLLCGIAGALGQALLTFDPIERDSLLIGASGSIFGLLGAALVLGSARLGRTRLLRIAIVLMAVNLGIGLASEAGWMGGYLIGWQAHAGGFLAGLLLAWPLRAREARAL
jgi:membrane associated rhomboid family serine protease